MDQINISLQHVSDSASRMKQLNAAMYENLNAMKNDMNLLNGSWISEGAEEVRSRFNMLSKRFDEYRTAIESYINFLEFTVSTYDSVESTITSNASTMQY